MIRLKQAHPALLGFFVTAAFSGCGLESDDQKPPAPPTAAELSRLAAETREPAYWLGPQIDGITVSHAATTGDEIGLTYGRWACDSGCSDGGGVRTGRRGTGSLRRFEYTNTGVDTEDCWTRVGEAVAVLLGCNPDGYPQELHIYTGSRRISVTSLYTPDGKGEIPARSVARQLRPLNDRAPWPLVRPKPLSCRSSRRSTGATAAHAAAASASLL